MDEHGRAADMTEALNTIKVLNERLQEAAKQLALFKIDFNIEIVQETLDVKITAIKPYGGGGVIKTVPKNIALYYKDDVASLTDSVVDEIVDALLKPMLKAQLQQPLARALNNVYITESKK